MVYYIRFLKPPRFQKHKSDSVSISAIISLTTDLGDSFLADDVDLLATLAIEGSGKVLYQRPLNWAAGKRELAVSLGPFAGRLSQEIVVLGVSAIDPRRGQSPMSDHLLGQHTVPLVISGWSAAFGGQQSLMAEKLIERRFGPEDTLDLRVWEETGNSIARHIW